MLEKHKRGFLVIGGLLLVLVITGSLFASAFLTDQLVLRLENVPVSVPPLSPTIVLTETKEVPVVQVVTVVTKEVLIVKPLQDFASYEELEAWLKTNGGIVLVADDNGIISLTTVDEWNDCDDQARRLQEKAEKDGYRLSVQIVDTGYLCGVEVSTPAHMGNLAIIGNLVYFVDVTQGNAIIKVCELDGGDI